MDVLDCIVLVLYIGQLQVPFNWALAPPKSTPTLLQHLVPLSPQTEGRRRPALAKPERIKITQNGI